MNWLLEFQIGAKIYHYANKSVAIDDMDEDGYAQDGHFYTSGLADLSLSTIVDLDLAVPIEIVSLEDWATDFQKSQWLIEGGKAILTFQDQDGALTEWIHGTVEKISWGAKGEPLTFTIQQRKATQTIPDPFHRIDINTQPDQDSQLPGTPASYVSSPNTQGKLYPVILGYPGDLGTESGTVYPVVPIPCCQIEYDPTALDADGNTRDYPLNLSYIIGDGWIDAEAGIWIGGKEDQDKSLSDEGATAWVPASTPQLRSTYQANDLRFQPYTYCVQTNVGLAEEIQELYAGFSPVGSYGGTIYRGNLIRSPSEIFQWIVEEWTDLRLDLGGHLANQQRFSSFKFDTFIDVLCDPLEWFVSEILDFIPAKLVRTKDGIHMVYMPSDPSPTDVVFKFVNGENCSRVDRNVESEIVNELFVHFRPDREQGFLTNVFVTSRERQKFSTDPRVNRNALCSRSQAIYQVRQGKLEVPSVWDQETAMRIALHHIAEHAFPKRTFTYSLNPKYHRARVGQVVMITDSELAFDERIMRIDDVIQSNTNTKVVLRSLPNTTDYL